MPIAKVKQLLGEPQGRAHRYGAILGTEDGRFDDWYMVYDLYDGRVVSLCFNMVGFETNVRDYPLIGFWIGTNDAQLLRKSK